LRVNTSQSREICVQTSPECRLLRPNNRKLGDNLHTDTVSYVKSCTQTSPRKNRNNEMNNVHKRV